MKGVQLAVSLGGSEHETDEQAKPPPPGRAPPLVASVLEVAMQPDMLGESRFTRRAEQAIEAFHEADKVDQRQSREQSTADRRSPGEAYGFRDDLVEVE